MEATEHPRGHDAVRRPADPIDEVLARDLVPEVLARGSAPEDRGGVSARHNLEHQLRRERPLLRGACAMASLVWRHMTACVRLCS